jgi:hypothetical protein
MYASYLLNVHGAREDRVSIQELILMLINENDEKKIQFELLGLQLGKLGCVGGDLKAAGPRFFSRLATPTAACKE